MRFGYKQRLELEPDLLAAIDAIKACDHMVWVHPVWWGGLPALLKGFIDRMFLPSIMFDYNEVKLGGMGWDGMACVAVAVLDELRRTISADGQMVVRRRLYTRM